MVQLLMKLTTVLALLIPTVLCFNKQFLHSTTIDRLQLTLHQQKQRFICRSSNRSSWRIQCKSGSQEHLSADAISDEATATETAEAVGYLVDSIKNGRFEELQSKGFQVKKKQEYTSSDSSSISKLEMNLLDDDVVQHVLDSFAAEVDDNEVEALQQLMQQRIASYSISSNSDSDSISISSSDGSSSGLNIDAAVIASLQQQAQQQMRRIISDNNSSSSNNNIKSSARETIVAGSSSSSTPTGAAADGKRGVESYLASAATTAATAATATTAAATTTAATAATTATTPAAATTAATTTAATATTAAAATTATVTAASSAATLREQLMQQAKAAHEANLREISTATDIDVDSTASLFSTSGSSSSESTGGEGPPINYAAVAEVEEEVATTVVAIDSASTDVDTDTDTDTDDAAAAAAAVSSSSTAMSTASSLVASALLNSNSNSSNSSDQDVEFAQLLRATIDAASAKAEQADAALKKNTIKAIASQANSATATPLSTATTSIDIAAEVATTTTAATATTTAVVSPLDVRGILGDTLFELTNTLGIDLNREISESPQAKRDLQNLMLGNAVEFANSLKELEEEGDKLNDMMENLKAELQRDAEELDNKKMDELDGLLQQQATARNGLMESQFFLQNSSQNLATVINGLNRDADLITSLALFPMKSIQQRAAFVIGLSLLFKVPFDAVNLIAVREFESSLWLSLLLQLGVSAACFDFYGLLRALFNTLSKNQQQQ